MKVRSLLFYFTVYIFRDLTLNRIKIAAEAFIIGIENDNYDSVSGAGTDPDCITSGCTPAEMAQYDGWAWNSVNALVLPSGSGTVTRSGTTYRITLTWDDDRDGTADDSFVFDFQP